MSIGSSKRLQLAGLALGVIVLGSVFAMKDKSQQVGRNMDLPLFDPFTKALHCGTTASSLGEFDAEANDWFQKAISMESREFFPSDRDYPQIVKLTQAAAARRHWKAMLNLASFRIEGRFATENELEAISLVEGAMLIGAPSAFDRMGEYHLRGKGGLWPDATKAFAFFQRAAQMGSPEAMVYLGEKLDVGPEYVSAGSWPNIPLAQRLYECAFRQGYGPAAYHLGRMYGVPRLPTGRITGLATAETKERALKILHEGVKLGCEECARELFAAFDETGESYVPHRDKARSQRYLMLTLALEFNPRRRFPNLDKVLPLPPTELPPWDGERSSLVEAAKGVRTRLAPIQITLPSKGQDRYFVNPAYSLTKSTDSAKGPLAPYAGYWKPSAPNTTPSLQSELAKLRPGLYSQNEPFDRLAPLLNLSRSEASEIVWERWITVRKTGDVIELFAADDAVRDIDRVVYRKDGITARTSPATGTWQPWVRADHPLAPLVNQFWRQAWVRKGLAFPDPIKDWLLDLPASELEWHLMEAEADATMAFGSDAFHVAEEAP